MTRWKPTELVIEMGTGHNNDVFFKPAGVSLRGYWSPRGYTNPSARTTGMMAAPDMPGMYVVIDSTKKTMRVVDPLSFPEFKKQLDAMSNVMHQIQGPQEGQQNNNLTDSQIKTAVWEASEAVRCGTARLVHGTIPKPKAIMDMPGRIRVRFAPYKPPEQGYEATEQEEARLLEIATAGAEQP